jgi:ABC-type spermidine/putrescine transport system permease subunit I
MALFTLTFFLVPLAALFAYSLGHSSAIKVSFGHSLANYSRALSDPFYLSLFGRALTNGLMVACISVLLAYPFAYAITLGPLRRRGELLLLAVLVSLFASYVVRVYAWRTLLGHEGILNTALSYGHLGPVSFLLFSRPAVVLTLVNVLVPLAVLPIYSALAQVDRSLLEAARDQGASPMRSILKVALPLSTRGVHASFALCFIIAAGDYITPQLVGGTAGQQIGNVIADQFGVSYNWPLGAALSFLLILFMGAIIAVWVGSWRLLGLRGART